MLSITYCGSTSSVSRMTIEGWFLRISSIHWNQGLRSLVLMCLFSSVRPALRSQWIAADGRTFLPISAASISM